MQNLILKHQTESTEHGEMLDKIKNNLSET